MTDRTIPLLEKFCLRCKTTKLASEFCKATRRPDGLQNWCRLCQQDRRREARRENPEYHRAQSTRQSRAQRARPGAVRAENLRDRYKMTVEQYEELLSAAGNACSICAGGPNGHGRFHVDHDHRCCPGTRSCGKCVRGLLCSRCNWLLGNAKDDVEVLRRAIEYLQR